MGLKLEGVNLPIIFFLLFQTVRSTMRDETSGDFGNTVTTGTLRVKFISQGEKETRHAGENDYSQCSISWENFSFLGAREGEPVVMDEPEKGKMWGEKSGMCGFSGKGARNVFFLTFIR